MSRRDRYQEFDIEDLATEDAKVTRLLEQYQREQTEKPMPKKPRRKVYGKKVIHQ